MRSLTKLICILILFPASLSAQFGISGNIGTGSYSMTSLKDYNSYLIYDYDWMFKINLTQLENFPSYWNYSFSLFYETPEKYRLSLGYQYLTTGSRLQNEDYSGFVRQDIIANAHSIRFSVSKELFALPFVNTGIFLTPQILLCKNKLIGSEKINPDPATSETWNLKSQNGGVETGVFLRKRISHFELSLEAGYYFDIYRGKMKGGSGNYIFELKNPRKNEWVRNNWNGYRIKLGTGYFF